MADNFLNKTGLQYYHDRIKLLFAEKTELPTKTSDLTNDGDGTDSNSPFATQAYVDANGGKIDSISVNNTPQTIDANKNVNITMPTKVSDLTNDSGFQTANDVDGSISDALANGNDPYMTESDVDTAIASAVSSTYKFKGTVATEQQLPQSGQETGDVYNITAASSYGPAGANVAWDGSAWDALGGIVDVSNLWTSQTGQTNTLIAITTAEIDTIVAGA